MVEANPVGPSQERLLELDEQIFGFQDDQIREFYNRNKDTVAELVEEIRTLAQDSSRNVQRQMVNLQHQRRDFKEMHR